MVSHKKRKQLIKKFKSNKSNKSNKKSGTKKNSTKRTNSKKNIHRKKSNSKVTWEKFLKHRDSRKALEKSWNSKNPQKYYESTIGKLAKKYSNKK